MSEFHHVSVLLDECIEGLAIKPEGTYVDGTLGGAGHSSHIAAKLTTGHHIGIDRDPIALKAAGERLKPYADRVTLVHSNFCEIKSVLDNLNIEGVDGILLDLGVSSHQLDTAERGFSYHAEAKLDMRMSQEGLSAYDVVNGYSQEELTRILRDYSEEKFASKIAWFIVKEREEAPIETTGQLVEIIKKAIPAAARREGGHPAKRTFQAIRIEVNNELGVLRQCISDSFDRLAIDGRFCIITFHSLEDRITKQMFAEFTKGCTCPPEFPICVCGKKPRAKLISRKPIEPSKEELERNNRSRSSKLRVLEKILD